VPGKNYNKVYSGCKEDISMKGILEISLIPIKINAKSASLSDEIARFFVLLKENKNVNVEIYPTSTVITGELEDIFSALNNAISKFVSGDIPRIVAMMKLDLRVDKEATPKTKYESVKEKINKLES
jgi:uncharacterized protein (TIGR00106 family)